MAQKFFSFTFIALLLTVIACDGVRVDPNGMGINVRIDPNAPTGPGSVTVDTAYMRLSEIEFEAEQEDGVEIEVEVDQLTTIDLITGASDPALPNLSIPAGRYEELELEARGAEDGGTVIYLVGSVEDSSGNPIPVRVDIREEFSLEMEWEDYEVDSTISFSATFFIDPSVWFTNIYLQELQQADQDANGVVNISPNDNVDIYNRLKALLHDGIEWEWDDD